MKNSFFKQTENKKIYREIPPSPESIFPRKYLSEKKAQFSRVPGVPEFLKIQSRLLSRFLSSSSYYFYSGEKKIGRVEGSVEL